MMATMTRACSMTRTKKITRRYRGNNRKTVREGEDVDGGEVRVGD